MWKVYLSLCSCIDSWFEINRSCPEHPSDWPTTRPTINIAQGEVRHSTYTTVCMPIMQGQPLHTNRWVKLERNSVNSAKTRCWVITALEPTDATHSSNRRNQLVWACRWEVVTCFNITNQEVLTVLNSLSGAAAQWQRFAHSIHRHLIGFLINEFLHIKACLFLATGVACVRESPKIKAWPRNIKAGINPVYVT